MPYQAPLIGFEAMTRRAIRLQGECVIFDLVFHLAAGTVELLIDYLSAGVLHVRHDKARVDALLGDLDLDHHSA